MYRYFVTLCRIIYNAPSVEKQPGGGHAAFREARGMQRKPEPGAGQQEQTEEEGGDVYRDGRAAAREGLEVPGDVPARRERTLLERRRHAVPAQDSGVGREEFGTLSGTTAAAVEKLHFFRIIPDA